MNHELFLLVLLGLLHLSVGMGEQELPDSSVFSQSEEQLFLRQGVCSSYNGPSCLFCLTQGIPCGWSSETEACTPTTDATAVSMQVGCIVPDTSDSDSEDEDTVYTIDVNPHFLIAGETNSTSSSTSELYSIKATSRTPTRCTTAIDGDNVLVTPKANWFGTCLIDLTATSLTPTQGSTTRLSRLFTLTYVSVNDPPVAADNANDVLGTAFNTIRAGTTARLDLCTIVTDADRVDYTISFSGGSSDVTFTADSCSCYTYPFNCFVEAEAEAVPASTDSTTVTITVEDAGGLTLPFEVQVAVEKVNHAPTVASAIGTRTISETSSGDSVSLSSVFTDIDGDELAITYGDSIFQLASEVNYDSDSKTLVITINSTVSGSVKVPITATDPAGLKVTDTMTFVVTEDNDSPVVIEGFQSTFEGRAGTSTVVDLTSYVSDEESSFAAGTLTCAATNATEAGFAFAKNLMTIVYLFPTEGTSFDVQCTDAGSLSVSFQLTITVTFVNNAPTIIRNFTTLTSVPGGSATYNLTQYFNDVDIPFGDSLSYTASSSSNLVSVTVTGSSLAVAIDSTAIGTYTVTVTATDAASAVATQRFSVLAYVAPNCSSIASTWAPASPLVLNLTNYCTSSNSYTATFVEIPDPNTIYDVVSTAVNGNILTITSSAPCTLGDYVGNLTLSDGVVNAIYVVRIKANVRATTITAKKSNTTYAVVQTLGNSTGFDGEVQVKETKVQINLMNLINLCNPGAIQFTYGSPTYQFTSGTTLNDMLLPSISGQFLTIRGSPPAALTRDWKYSLTIFAQDKKYSSTTSFTLNLVKSYRG